MDFVEDHDRFHTGAEKYLRIADHILNHGQITVNVKEARGPEAFRQGGFARPPDTAEPGNRGLAPGGFDALLPKRPCNHGSRLCTRAYQM